MAPYLIVWGYVGIYRRKEYVDGAPRGPRGRGAPPTLVPPLRSTDVPPAPIYTYVS